MTVAFYISGHGFGHASRDVEIVNALAAKRPDVRWLLRTSAEGQRRAAVIADMIAARLDPRN